MPRVYRKNTRNNAVWTPEIWDEGLLKTGRFRVYRPDFPNADGCGRAYRYHVVWWLAYGEVILPGMHMHHKNGNPLDDRLENLELLTAAEHGRIHAPIAKERPLHTCLTCGAGFLPRVDTPGIFCSLSCKASSQNKTRNRKPVEERPLLTYQCERCGLVFSRRASTGKKPRYCSNLCSSSAHYHRTKVLKR